MRDFEKDKEYILNWMRQYCHGYKNAEKKDQILPCIQRSHSYIDDRYFRKIMSALYHEGHVGSTNTRGYWFIPLVNLSSDRREVDAALESVNERESRAKDMLTGCAKLKEKFLGQGKQKEMFG